MAHTYKPVACSLSTASGAVQVLEWTDLRRHAIATEPLDGGIAMTFDVDLADRVEDLAARETACCGFLSIATTRANQTVRLEITSDNPEAHAMIEALSGTILQ